MIKIEYGNKFLKDLKKLKHTEVYSEIIGNYRIGIRLESNILYLGRVLHRKEIYKYFP
jgi:mRNA interferase RelE/StbE